MSSLSQRPADPVVGESHAHESAALHVTGTALYTDDLVNRYPGILHACPVGSPHAHARITGLRVDAALGVPGVVRVLTSADVPGVNDAGTKHDEPLFPVAPPADRPGTPGGEVMFVGHAVCWVLAESLEAAREGAAAVEVDYEPLPAVLTLTDAIARGSFHGARPTMLRGDAASALRTAASDPCQRVMSGTFEFSGQEHFYLETQASVAVVDESGQIFIQCSTQHPTETQDIVSHVLGIPANAVTVQSLRMGGGFGGKEMQPHGYAAVAALGAVLTGRPVRVRLSRAQDMVMTGKRHGFHSTWTVGYTDEGRLTALDVTLTADGGWSLDLSEPVLARAMCHIDNAYRIPDIAVHGRIALCHRTSQTAFRGFGGPQGMIVIEDIMGRIAQDLGLPAREVRRRNFYRSGDRTPYDMPVRHPERLEAAWDQVLDHADVVAREAEIEAFNATHRDRKRALAMTPVKFGISFNLTAFNQGGALVLVYKDGSVLVNHGGTEMGQGLHTKMMQVAATTLGVPLSMVRSSPTRTDKVPNTSATAASSGADLNGGAVKDACGQIISRLRTVAASRLGVNPADVRFSRGRVTALGVPGSLTWEEVVATAYSQRVQLSASGFYRTEGLHWDASVMQGEPFKYFAYGVAAAEVEVSRFDGSCALRRVDIVHDVGDSLSPLIDLGQIEGGFVQGAGWLTLEDLRWDDGSHDGDRGTGRLTTAGASTYKIPSLSELPPVFNIELLDKAHEEGAVYGSKAVGEPPFMLAFSVREALRQAVAAFGDAREPGVGSGVGVGRGTVVELPSPATPEAVFWAVQRVRGLRSLQPVSS
ncbi:xanthine dehydrogenase molybdopterin binding subunit [Corynebacterium neomassiliense]|uniref:xanthine dehydrogenase molybdopterin binding subunit n=1 Tax=Corynebacterium neomassiliense TaxID=2079482 RepID=UPI001031B008|nr:xanthine dehydrogenase molybdopterin binding subunit [Corynebacterium neomassiliense]